MSNIPQTKEFNRYRVRLTSAAGGPRVLITDKKECDRVVVKIEAENGKECFDSVNQESIDRMIAFIESDNDTDLKQSFANSVKCYVYGIIDLVTEMEWFNSKQAVHP